MHILYTRVSTESQNSDRQKQIDNKIDKIIEDHCSGTIPFFDRPEAKRIKKLIDKDVIDSMTVHSVDRLGRNLIDGINTIEFFNEKGIPIHIEDMGLTTLVNGKMNPYVEMIISVRLAFAKMERETIRERQMQGIRLAKKRGVYKGRQKGSVEGRAKFLAKYQEELEQLKRGLKVKEVAALTGTHTNTIYKVRSMINVKN